MCRGRTCHYAKFFFANAEDAVFTVPMAASLSDPVLLVVPDPAVAAALQRRLARRLGVLPIIANTLGDALTVTKAQPVGAVILDVDSLGGPVAYYLMDLVLQHPDVPRVGIGRANRGEASKLMEANLIDGLVQPPIELDEVLHFVRPHSHELSELGTLDPRQGL